MGDEDIDAMVDDAFGVTGLKQKHSLKVLTQDSEWRKANASAIAKRTKDPAWLKRNSDAAKKRSKDPAWIKANAEAHAKLAQDPAWRKALSDAKEKYSTPVICIDFCYFFSGVSKAQRRTGINRRLITKAALDQKFTAGSCHWRYATTKEAEQFKEGKRHGF